VKVSSPIARARSRPVLNCRGIAAALLVCGFAPAFAADVAYRSIEASFQITGLASDPFDYAVTDVRVSILQPDATTITLPVFFDGGTTWRVRHTPMLPGAYVVTATTLNGSPVAVSNLNPASWLVAGDPISAGIVRRDPANASRFITSNGRRYFPFGHNLAWDVNGTTNVVSMLARLGAAGETWSRIWMDDWDGKNLEWPRGGAFGQYNLTVAQKWDSIINAAEQAGVAFQMTLNYHGQYSTTVDPEWNSNPYNSANGGFLTNATQFFTDTTAKALVKRKLRYVIARWGYSPAIMAWELFNEVQFTDAAQNGQWSIVGAWHDEMAQFIRSQDPWQHLVATSSQLDQPIWNQCDFYSHHDYPSDLISALRDPAGVPNGQPIKPVFGGESGSDPTFYYGLHAPLWAGLMGAQSGAAEPWYWDRIDAENGYGLMRATADYIRRSGIGDQDTLIKTAPHVTCAQNSALVFSFGGSWGNTVQDAFTVGEVAPNGVGTAPSFLQGDFHRTMTPNGYTFQVNYPQTGTFSVQIVTIARSGAGLRVTVDATTTNTIMFPATASDIATNYTMTVAVPAGTHTIKLWNPGLDWVNLGNLSLSPYVPILGAYQIGNTDFAALWLWHRTNIYNPSAASSVGGSFPLSGLSPGTYNGAWWDTFAGGTISNFNFSVVDTNPEIIGVPPILRSLAFFAGKPPQAAINVPSMVRVLGTNSPNLVLPLTITNGGGLPLSWSLSVTGVSPIVYSAINSTQSGGPTFAWKDISQTGQELTGSFTALTAKTARDEGIVGPINPGFAFPFFSGGQAPGLYSQIYVSPNGFITFSPFGGDTGTNAILPNPLAPTNMIAFFWNDLDATTTGRVYADTDSISGAFTLQFQNVRFKNSSLTTTCQLILKSSGEILMQYKALGIANACTVGLQNAAANQGLQVAFNQNYLQTNFAVRITPHSWLGLSANGGLAPKTSVENVNLTLKPSAGYGSYRANLLVNTGDTTQPATLIPIALDVTPIATWRQARFGTAANTGNSADTADPDHDGLINILEYAFNTDPTTAEPYPINFAFLNGHLTLTFKRAHPAPSDLTFLFEVAADLSSGIWQSGPAYTSQQVTDHLDGTETVVVTDLSASPNPAAHFLRVRVSHP
jgi:hypothetical protein